ncbi:iolD protein [Caballeronia udeis]|uniref:IolD protein n=1 Tax=Caballeronia udeis TaxID=1232866 RepID=A0A158I9Y1_9BURK|nr:3D-(3,5/4)-trihydroxycyclohexane-1,2-dione acylhydrolase (decyclizing) [Caballeronia udeis]SAL53374.1 iolD protein [Caballeronia udeis]
MSTIRCTVAQAIVRYLKSQLTEIDGKRVPLFPGVFGIFGHGNVTCLAEALEAVKDEFPTWRGQNEQSMALAAIAFAKAKRRRQIMVATSSIGPGATNFVTAAGLAHANRLPILFLSGDTFASRRPDPVLQQVEHFNDPSMTVNDAFKAVTRYWDRITHPEQIISSLPQAVAVMLDPADCGPAFLGLCQDIQEVAFDYPAAFFEPTVHSIPRPRPDSIRVAQAVAVLKEAQRPIIIAGGGVRYSEAEQAVVKLAQARGIPIVETIAGKGTLTHDHPVHIGPLGIVGSTSANALAGEADVVFAIGTRLQDFTTGSWSCFSHGAKFVAINTARFDAVKHRSLALIGDARETVTELDAALGDWHVDASWLEHGRREFARWNDALDAGQKHTDATVPTYAQVVGVVNEEAAQRDYVISAAGGLPGELVKGWRVKAPGTFDCEFGFSCMGYEIAGGWGAAMADPTRDVFVMVGDGSYMMMNSDIYSSVLAGHKMIVLVCDNGGFGVINRLQNGKGGASFNNLLKDSKVKEAFPVDFIRHAESMGALARRANTLDELRDALKWAKSNDRTTVISIVTDAFAWTPGDAWWDVGVPQVSEREEVQAARKDQEKGRMKQRIGV